MLHQVFPTRYSGIVAVFVFLFLFSRSCVNNSICEGIEVEAAVLLVASGTI